MSWARSRERAVRDIRFRRARWCLSAGGSCSRRTGHPFAASGFLEPSQKIELGFSASPETIRTFTISACPKGKLPDRCEHMFVTQTRLFLFLLQAKLRAAFG